MQLKYLWFILFSFMCYEITQQLNCNSYYLYSSVLFIVSHTTNIAVKRQFHNTISNIYTYGVANHHTTTMTIRERILITHQ